MSSSDEDSRWDGPRQKARQPRCGTPIHVPEPEFDRNAQDLIGRDLRAMYEALLLEPVPHHLLELVSRVRGMPLRSVH